MTDRLRSCKDSPDGKHCPERRGSLICGYCRRTFSYLMDQGWRAPNDNAAEQLVKRGQWNSIEPEEK